MSDSVNKKKDKIGLSYTKVDFMKVPDVFRLMMVAHYIYGHKLSFRDVTDVRFYGYSEIQKGLESLGVWMSCDNIKDALHLGSRFEVRVVGHHIGGLWLLQEDTRQVRNKDAIIVRTLDWSVYFRFLQVCNDNKIVEHISDFREYRQQEDARKIVEAIMEKNAAELKDTDIH